MGAPNTGTVSTKAKPADPLGDAWNKVREKITNKFAVIMASGTLRAGKVAALATEI